MSTLYTIAYPDQYKAEAALATLQDLQRQQLIQLEDAVIARHEGDKIKLDQALNMTSAGAVGGALWGGLFGLIFLMPVVGLAIGAASGAIVGKFSDYGINDNFAKDMQAKLQPGHVALVLLVGDAVTDRVVAELKKHHLGGTLIQTNLSAEDEAKLRALVGA